MGPLEGIKIIEFAGLGPAPFCAMMLADMGADVIRIERPKGQVGSLDVGLGKHDILARNRRVLHVDIKSADGQKLLKSLIEKADGLIEGFRPGVMEKLGLGPDDCAKINKKLVFGRMTGWGQTGELSQQAGHDINYIAANGILDMIGNAGGATTAGEPPAVPPAVPPTLVGDMGGGAMFLAFGMLAGILSAARTGEGQVVDAAIIDGSALLSSVVWGIAGKYHWGERGTNLLDGGAHFYGVYECSDGKYISVGALEPKFYSLFLDKLGLADDADFSQQMNMQAWAGLKEKVADIFRSKPRDHWAELFKGSDACVFPVLNRDEALANPHLATRSVFVEVDGVTQPAPAPRFDKTPAEIKHMAGDDGVSEADILKSWGVE
ncbi:MAG: CoA transferase [Sphingomonadales bacterium]|nr:CoA transferase [Sphingomonadales bacterium]